ncbi:phospholipase-like protein [Tanacetum coccineum]
MQDPLEYRFPWGYRDIVVDREFWLVLACLDKIKEGWLKDSHLDLWVDLMWYFREPDADWAMVSPHFLPCTLGGSMIDYYSNGVRYPVAWRDVEKVYFLVNEPKKHWCLAGLHISTRVVTFYGLSHNLPLTVDDPLQTALAYRERMLQYFWRHKIEAEKTVVLDEDYMPFEMQIEIMNRLPVKSLLQFRTVSKSWKPCIDSSTFFFNYGVLNGNEVTVVEGGGEGENEVMRWWRDGDVIIHFIVHANLYAGFWSGDLMSYVDLVKIQRISLTGFPAQSVGSSNIDVLDSPCLLVLITGTSQSRQHESCYSPTIELFEVDSIRFPEPPSFYGGKHLLPESLTEGYLNLIFVISDIDVLAEFSTIELKSKHADKTPYSASAEDIEVASPTLLGFRSN